MDELVEIIHVRQVPGDPRRRWFSSDDMDLIVWYDDSDAPIDISPRYKATPILVADGHFDARRVADIFTASSRHIPPDIAQFVSLKLRLFSSVEKA